MYASGVTTTPPPVGEPVAPPVERVTLLGPTPDGVGAGATALAPLAVMVGASGDVPVGVERIICEDAAGVVKAGEMRCRDLGVMRESGGPAGAGAGGGRAFAVVRIGLELRPNTAVLLEADRKSTRLNSSHVSISY